jgi:hypothetical protein
VTSWLVYFVIGGGLAWLTSKSIVRKARTDASATAAGLRPVGDLTHLPQALQKTALWSMSEGGFERRMLYGILSRNAHDIDVTAFDLETLRERRGEWAWLPVDAPFRIGGVVSIVTCEIDRAFPHLLLKRVGAGDDLPKDEVIERALHLAKSVRAAVGMSSAFPAELPRTLPTARIDAPGLPEGWRAYGDADLLGTLLAAGFASTLEQAGRRDMVIEMIASLVIVYPAMRDVIGADAVADLTSTALALTDGVLASSPALSPRGVEKITAEPV